MFRLTVIFSLLLLFSSCGTKTETDNITPSQWELFSYLPQNTEYLLYANLDAVRKTKAGEENLATSLPEEPGGGWLRKFEQATGAGLKKGIREITIAKTRDDNAIVVVKVEKNYRKVRSYFRDSPEFQKKTDSTYSLKEMPSTIVYFPGNNIVIVSNRENYIESFLSDRKNRLIANSELVSIIENIKEKNSIWMATDKGAFAAGIFDRIAGKDSKLLSPEILSSIDNFSVSAEFNNGAQIESALGCTSAGNAYLIAAAVEGAIAMNILSHKNYKLGKIFDKMDINREGKLIRFHLNLSDKEIDDIKQLTKLDNQVNNSKGKLW
jgi:hypothetical protein